MTRRLAYTMALLLVVLCGCREALFPGSQGDFNQQFFNQDYWFEGKAELNFYRAVERRYRQDWPAQVVHILVTEDLKPDELVKADDWREPDLIPVLKLNTVIEVPTGVYTYRQMASVFFHRETLHNIKESFTSHEWCGNSFKELVNFGRHHRFHAHTYWDGMAEVTHPLPDDPTLIFYDGLPAFLRATNLEAGKHIPIRLLPSQISSRAPLPEAEQAEISVGREQLLSVPAGGFVAYPVVLQFGQGEDIYWFESAFPNRLLQWERYDGARYELLESKKLAYWELHNPGDEDYLPPSFLQTQ